MRSNPKFAHLIPAYLESCRQKVIGLQNALDRRDFQTLEVLGHGMKGAGGMFGFPAITDIGAAIQEAAELADIDASRKWVGELSICLDRVGRSSE